MALGLAVVLVVCFILSVYKSYIVESFVRTIYNNDNQH